MKQFCVRSSVPFDQLMLYDEVAIDLVRLRQTPILRVVDIHTSLQNRTVFRGKTAHDLWLVFVECWTTLYSGYPDIIRLDQEVSFTLKFLRDLVTAQRIELQVFGA